AHPTILSSFAAGFQTSAPATATGLQVRGTQDDFGVFAFGGSTLTLVGGNIDQNLNGGMEVDHADRVTATNTSFSSNRGTGVDVFAIDGLNSNATFIGTHIDSNTGTGLTNEGNKVFVLNGATINGNKLGVSNASGALAVDGSAGTVNINNNLGSGGDAADGTVNLKRSEIDGNSANSTLALCDTTHRRQAMAVVIHGNAALTMSATGVKNNFGGGVSVNTNGAAAAISSSSITGNSATGGQLAPANCGDYDGIEAISAVNITGSGSHVDTNHGHGVDVRAQTL